MSVFVDAIETLANFLPVAFFSVLAFWKPNPVLFMLAAGTAMMTGLYWDGVGELGLRLTIGILLVGYSLLCIAYAYRILFWNEEREE